MSANDAKKQEKYTTNMPRTSKPTKRSVHDIETPTEKELLEGILRMPIKYGSYACFCYLFGNRVSEGLGLRKTEHVADYRYYKTVKKRDSNGIKYVEKKAYYIPKLKQQEGYEIEPLAPWRISFHENDTISVQIRVYKRTGRPQKTKIVDPLGPGEAPFANVLRYFVERSKDNYYLWSYSRQTAYRHFMKHLKVPPHKLREMRATKLAVTYKMTAGDLQVLFGWVDSKMPLYYESKNINETAQKMINQRQE